MTSAIPERHKGCLVPYRYGTCWYQQSTTPVTFSRCFLLDPAIRSGTASGSTAIPVRHEVCPVPYQNGTKYAQCHTSTAQSMPSAIPERHKVCPMPYRYGKSMPTVPYQCWMLVPEVGSPG